MVAVNNVAKDWQVVGFNQEVVQMGEVEYHEDQERTQNDSSTRKEERPQPGNPAGRVKAPSTDWMVPILLVESVLFSDSNETTGQVVVIYQ